MIILFSSLEWVYHFFNNQNISINNYNKNWFPDSFKNFANSQIINIISVGCTGLHPELHPELHDKLSTSTQFPVSPGTEVEVSCKPGYVQMSGNMMVITCAQETWFYPDNLITCTATATGN